MYLLTRNPVLGISLLLLVGMGLATFLGESLVLPTLILAILAALFGLSLVILRATNWLLIPVGLLILCVGVGYVAFRSDRLPSVTKSVGLDAARAVIVSSSQTRLSDQRAYVDVQLQDQIVRVRATWSSGDQVRYGDVVKLTGEVVPPRVDPTFNERGFLLAHHAHATMTVSSLQPTGVRAGHPILRTLHDTRSWLLQRLNTVTTLPARSVMAGVLLGDQSSLGPELEQAFRDTGTTHILVVSGSNVVIIAWLLDNLLGGWGRRRSALVVTLVLLGFVVISGADASVIRATIFYEFILLARLTGRRIHALTLATFVALLMTLGNPWILLHDIAFQLSFAAVLGLMLLGGWFYGLLPRWLLPEFLAPALAAHLATLPLLVYHFGQASVVAPLANLLVVPLVPAIMAGGALALAFPWLPVFAWATQGTVSVLLWIVTTLAGVPRAALTLPAHHLVWTSLSLLLLAIVLLVRYRQSRRLIVIEEGYGLE